jgi:hypothetical protein
MTYPALSAANGIRAQATEFGKLLYYRVKYGLLGK